MISTPPRTANDYVNSVSGQHASTNDKAVYDLVLRTDSKKVYQFIEVDNEIYYHFSDFTLKDTIILILLDMDPKRPLFKF